ncbi:MAG: 23S rRNA (pseudouridine(1915)-N(3))-methyltransferase RlmH [Bacillota bacterium]|nr:23S rRNA (pseudouridine(1915)-N(3))-methyltransferase RlmH [Bacillota bacterium]
MKIIVVAVGNLKEAYFRAAAQEYIKRLTPCAQVAIVEIPESKTPINPSPADEANARDKEGERIIKAIPPGSYVAMLAIEGKARSSEHFADWIEHKRLSGRSHLTFVIGGSTGLSSDVKAKADDLISFGPITLPHQLARIVLLEQTYRAFRILRNEPYHK